MGSSEIKKVGWWTFGWFWNAALRCFQTGPCPRSVSSIRLHIKALCVCAYVHSSPTGHIKKCIVLVHRNLSCSTHMYSSAPCLSRTQTTSVLHTLVQKVGGRSGCRCVYSWVSGSGGRAFRRPTSSSEVRHCVCRFPPAKRCGEGKGK